MLAAATFVAADATADDHPEKTASQTIAPGVTHQTYAWQTGSGPVQVNVLRWSLDDDRVILRPELATGVVPGRELVATQVLRLGGQAIAGVNGGFWDADPVGDPRGFFVRDGEYISQPTNELDGNEVRRGAFALTPGGVDRTCPNGTEFPNAAFVTGYPGNGGRMWFDADPRTVFPIHAINRRPRADEVVAFTPSFGPRTDPAGRSGLELFLAEANVRPDRINAVTVTDVRAPGGSTGTTGAVTLLATGRWAESMTALAAPGATAKLDFDLTDVFWPEIDQALGAGPLLLDCNARTTRDDWVGEGFDDAHNLRAHPRTIAAFTPGGEMLLITVDGRQSGWSVGTSTLETQILLQKLGVTDAVMLDGGGSTQMSIDGRYVNRPALESDGRVREVANALVLYSTVETPDVLRLQGANRYGTAADTAAQGWPDGADTVLLASGEAFPDGLAGGPLGAALDAPLLLTQPSRLPKETRAALEALGPDQVIVLGGTAAVSEKVATAVADLGYRVERLWGETRVHTAAAIADRLGAPSGRAFLASGRAFPDALSATVPAALADAPLLLTDPARLDAATLEALVSLAVKEVFVAGGTSAVGDEVVAELKANGLRVVRLAGADRYGTSTALATWAESELRFTPRAVAVASGADFPDALSGGPYAVRVGAPLLLTRPEDIRRSKDVAAWLDAHAVGDAHIFGGRAAVRSWVAFQLQTVVDR